MRTRSEDRRRAGVALVSALGAIVVIGVVLGGVVFMSTHEARAASGAFGQERAFRAAEAGLNTALASWNSAATANLPVGAVFTEAYSGIGWNATVRSTKLNPNLYSLASTATVHPGTPRESRKTTSLSIRLSPPQFNLLGALTVRGNMRIGGSSSISGFDVNPPSWSGCGATQPTKPGIVQGLTGATQWQGCPSLTCVEGDPKFQLNASADSLSTYFDFGDLDWDALTAMADKVYPGSASVGSIGPSETNGVCNTGVQNNWGQPYNTHPAGACENYFPIVHFKGPGTAKITSGGSGQGILLVDDNLEISGGLEFYGIVVVRNTITTTGNGGRVRGGLMAANLNLDENTVLGDATVRYSSCAIERVSAGAAIPIRIANRAWAEMH
jgi:hypothetical protein